jgi:hypothetical protein
METNTVKITIEADGKNAEQEFKKFQSDTLSGLSSIKAGYLAAAAASAGFIASLKSFINEAAEAEQIENRLKFALETTGYSWQASKSAVDDFANSVQQMTRFSDEQARQALTDMMLYTQDFAKAQMAAKLAMDMSVRTGHDLGSSSRLIGMAMTGNVEMLGRYLPQLRNLETILGADATMAQKAEYALKILNEKFGGTAASDLNTYSGQVEQLKNAWGDFKETIGELLIGPAKDFVQFLKDAATGAKNFIDLFKSPKTDAEALKSELNGINNQLKIMDFWFKESAAGNKLFRVSSIVGEEHRAKYDTLLARKGEIERILEGEKSKVVSKPDVYPDAGKTQSKYIEDLIKQYERILKAETDAYKAGKEYEALDLKKQQDGVEALRKEFEGMVAAETDAYKAGKEYEALDLKKQQDGVEALRKEFEGMVAAETDAYKAGKEYTALDFKKQADEIEKMRQSFLKMAAAEEQGRKDDIEWEQGVAAKKWEKQKKEIQQIQTFWDQTAIEMGQSAMTNFFGSMNTGFKDLGDRVKSIGMDIIGMLQKMITNAILFGNIMGQQKSGGGYGGLVGVLGGALSSIFSPGTGGGNGGGAGVYGYNDARPATVTNYNINNTFIDAIDQKSITDRVTGPVFQGLSSTKYKQAMRNLIRSRG